MLITEVMAQPDAGLPEWVEILNPDDSPQVITGFVLKDVLASPSILYTFPEITVQAGEYHVVELSGSKLNNSGDGVTLYRPDGTLVDEMAFSSSQKGLSWQKYVQGWCESLPTPGSTHTCPEPTPTPIPSVSPSPSPVATLNTATITPSPSSANTSGSADEYNALDTSISEAHTAAIAAQAAIDAKLAMLQRVFVAPVVWEILSENSPQKPTAVPPPTTSPVIDIQSHQLERVFPAQIVIMGGLLVVTSIFIPTYDQIKPYFTRLGQRLTPSSTLGSIHLRPQRSVSPSKSGELAT